MMVKDPVVAPGAVGANAMATPMVKVVLLGCASGGEEPGDEQRNDQKSKHRILLLVRFGAKDDGKRPPRFQSAFPSHARKLYTIAPSPSNHLHGWGVLVWYNTGP